MRARTPKVHLTADEDTDEGTDDILMVMKTQMKMPMKN